MGQSGALLTPYRPNNNVFTLTGYVGFFIFESYLSMVQTCCKILLALIATGVALTALGTYVLAAADSGTGMYFFQQYFSLTIILTSVAVLLLLLTTKPPTPKRNEALPKSTN